VLLDAGKVAADVPAGPAVRADPREAAAVKRTLLNLLGVAA